MAKKRMKRTLIVDDSAILPNWKGDATLVICRDLRKKGSYEAFAAEKNGPYLRFVKKGKSGEDFEVYRKVGDDETEMEMFTRADFEVLRIYFGLDWKVARENVKVISGESNDKILEAKLVVYDHLYVGIKS